MTETLTRKIKKVKQVWPNRPVDIHLRIRFHKGGRRVTLRDLTDAKLAAETAARTVLESRGYSIGSIDAEGTYSYQNKI